MLVSLYPRVKYLKLSEMKTRSWHGAVLECRTRDPDVPSSNPSVGKKKNLSQVQSEQYHHQSLYTRVKYLKLSEMKTRSWHGAVLECRTRDPEIPSSNPGVGKNKIPHRSNQNITTTNPLHQSEVPEIDRCKKQNHCCAVVECRTRDPEVPSSNPGVGKNKIPHRSNQNITTTNPLHQSEIPEIDRCEKQNHCCAVVECRTRHP